LHTTALQSAPTRAPASRGWLARLAQRQLRYIAVDGGSGAHLLAGLAQYSLRLQRVATPRHADVLIVVGPISRKLAPAVAALARAVPQPAHALIAEPAADATLSHRYADQVPATDILPNARVVAADPQALLAAALQSDATAPLTVSDAYAFTEETIPLPPSQQREIATELAVFSLGPLQPFTAGPLRLWLVCDGEQVFSCQVEAGYAARGIAEAMRASDWQAGAALARQIDPVAPIAGQLAYTQAIERLQGTAPSSSTVYMREAAVALERAVNQLWWATRFFRLLDAPRLALRAGALAATSADIAARLWSSSPLEWAVPHGGAPQRNTAAQADMQRLADQVSVFARRVQGDRLLRLRTAGIGQISDQRLREAQVTGPTMIASLRGAGDVQSRLVTRLEQFAATDLRWAAQAETNQQRDHEHDGGKTESGADAIRWDAPPGDVRVHVDGPRGQLGLRLASDGGERPTLVEWRRPSAAALALLPTMLAGQKLADAEIIVASLDLAMAEADG